jgi:hypothetical protein
MAWASSKIEALLHYDDGIDDPADGVSGDAVAANAPSTLQAELVLRPMSVSRGRT